ncbi:putative ORfan [Saudi moumouvirus]|nr:putative ORfan [Saudi moumouvirus]
MHGPVIPFDNIIDPFVFFFKLLNDAAYIFKKLRFKF